ncbi:MAG: PhzF family phenazine biosynthesis protein [Mycobacteriales bacterium]
MTLDIRVVRVFTGPDGEFGNPLGVVLDGAAVPEADRQPLAAELGYSETVFVDDAATGRVRIFTPSTELPFAGHPSVGTAWLLREVGSPVEALRPPAGEVRVTYDGDLTWVRARAEWAPEMTIRRYDTPAEVDALAGAPDGVDFFYAWAWRDEAAGEVRSRSFPVGIGIEEDEATGAAAVRLAALLGRGAGQVVTIHQGRGSVLYARSAGSGYVEIGGRVVPEEAST